MFADLMMKLAAVMTPKTRGDWHAAMQGEYAALTRGRTGWALGCLGTAAGWRLKADGVWAISLLAGLPYLHDIANAYWFWVYAGWDLNTPVVWYAIVTVPSLVLCSVMGFIWSRRAWKTSLLAMLGLMIGAYMTFWIKLDQPLLIYVHHWDRPPVIGESILLVITTLSVWTGAGLRRLVSRTR